MGVTCCIPVCLGLLFCGRSMERPYKSRSSLYALLIDGLSSFKGRGGGRVVFGLLLRGGEGKEGGKCLRAFAFRG